MHVVAKIKMSSANRRFRRVGPPSPKSSPSPPTVRRHIPIAISNTAQNSRGVNTHPCLTPRLMSNSLLLSLVPAICPVWSLYKFCKSQTIWSLIPCWDKAHQSAGQCRRSKAFDKSKLIIQIGMFTLQGLSITKCSSMQRPDRNPRCSSGWAASKKGSNTTQNHISKRLVQKADACNGPILSRNLRTAMFWQHIENSFAPVNRSLRRMHQTIEKSQKSVEEVVRSKM